MTIVYTAAEMRMGILTGLVLGIVIGAIAAAGAGFWAGLRRGRCDHAEPYSDAEWSALLANVEGPEAW